MMNKYYKLTKDMFSQANLGKTYRFQTPHVQYLYEKIGFYLDLFSW